MGMKRLLPLVLAVAIVTLIAWAGPIIPRSRWVRLSSSHSIEATRMISFSPHVHTVWFRYSHVTSGTADARVAIDCANGTFQPKHSVLRDADGAIESVEDWSHNPQPFVAPVPNTTDAEQVAQGCRYFKEPE